LRANIVFYQTLKVIWDGVFFSLLIQRWFYKMSSQFVFILLFVALWYVSTLSLSFKINNNYISL